MRLDRCYFLEACPEIEVCGQFVFVQNGSRKTVVPPVVMAEFIAKARLALMEISERPVGNVVPFRARH